MPGEEWIKTLADGRRVKFIYQELPEDRAFFTAQLAGNEAVYSVVLTKAGNPLSREDVESHFKGRAFKEIVTLNLRHYRRSNRFKLDHCQSIKNFLTRMAWLRYT
jgi:hypothetical protein